MNNVQTKIKTFFAETDFKKVIKSFFYDTFRMPLYLITHPIRGFDEFKREKKSKGYVAWFYLILMILTQIIAFNGNGYLVNKNIPKDFNLLLTIALVAFPVAVFTVGNWASTALMNGKGTMTEIFRVICYSFFPLVWLGLLSTIVSNYITIDEIVFFNFIKSIASFVFCFMAFFGLMGIHEFGLLKNILMFIVTVVAIGVILFVMLLFLSLIQQMYSFLESVFGEFSMRFL